MISEITGGVTAAKGFRAASCAAGIKYQGRTDMAMIACSVPCAVAGTFTSNQVKAAPVLWDMDVVFRKKQAQAVVVNAGIANAATGETGLALCRETAEYTGNRLGIPADSVLVGSTGVIGPNIPVDRISAGVDMMVPALADTAEAGTAASRAIMTTDTVNKERAVRFTLPGNDGKDVTITLGGMSKGSGMIHPNMCTMLAYLTTDCAVDQALLQQALREVVKDTFNMISVDGDTSTNDTLLVLASGLAGNKPVTSADDPGYAVLKDALFTVCRSLAVLMAGDGEGATHLIEMTVTGADTKENARTLARSVVSSSLVKAMIYGKDANCGRILCALGYAGPAFNPDRVDLYLLGSSGDVCFCLNGRVQEFDEDKALEILSGHDVRFTADMHMGSESAVAWGCDLTYDYVKINGDYRS